MRRISRTTCALGIAHTLFKAKWHLGQVIPSFKYSWNKLWFCKNDLSPAQPMTSCEWVRLQKMICNLPSNAAYNTRQGGWEELTKCIQMPSRTHFMLLRCHRSYSYTMLHPKVYENSMRKQVTPCLPACRNLLFRSISRHLLAPNWTSVAGATDLAKSFKPKSSFNAAICWNYHLQIYYDLLIASNRF